MNRYTILYNGISYKVVLFDKFEHLMLHLRHKLNCCVAGCLLCIYGYKGGKYGRRRSSSNTGRAA